MTTKLLQFYYYNNYIKSYMSKFFFLYVFVLIVLVELGVLII